MGYDIATAVWFGTGAVFCLIALAIMLVTVNMKRRYSAKTSATIINAKRIWLGRRNHYQTIYRLTYEYCVNSVKYTDAKLVYRKDAYPAGYTISITYNPHQPQLSRIPSSSDRAHKVAALAFAVPGLTLIAIGIIWMV